MDITLWINSLKEADLMDKSREALDCPCWMRGVIHFLKSYNIFNLFSNSPKTKITKNTMYRSRDYNKSKSSEFWKIIFIIGSSCVVAGSWGEWDKAQVYWQGR